MSESKAIGEAESFRASVSIPGKTSTRLTRPLTFQTISNWIKLQGFDDYTTKGLIAIAARYPTQALPSFRRNFNVMIERVRQQRKKEQQKEKENDEESK